MLESGMFSTFENLNTQPQTAAWLRTNCDKMLVCHSLLWQREINWNPSIWWSRGVLSSFERDWHQRALIMLPILQIFWEFHFIFFLKFKSVVLIINMYVILFFEQWKYGTFLLDVCYFFSLREVRAGEVALLLKFYQIG